MMKSKLISLDGIVRNSCPAENQNKIPCQIRIFARFEAFPTVKAEISKGGFQLMGSVITKSEKEMKSVDEIFKIIGENVSKTLALKLMDAPKTVIKSDLFVHQKEGLGWLFHRENTGELPPFWEEKEDGSYVNLLSKLHTIERPEPLRGGIFADDTGMGKTLTLLSLIACDRYSASSSSTDSGSLDVHKLREISDQGEGFTILGCKRGRVGEMDPAASKKLEASSSKVNTVCVDDKSVTHMGTKTTLVLCHPSVVETWEEHLEEHTVPDKLKVYKYYGNRTRDPEELRKYDIVLTTYSTLGSEARWLSSPLKLLVWWRIILDDAHIIKYLHDQQRQCVINLNSKRSFWQNLIQKPLEQGHQKGLLHYQVLTKTIGLRRMKSTRPKGLPPKLIETCYVELSKEERELYDKVERGAKGVVQSNSIHGNLMHDYTVFRLVLRLRQICTESALYSSDVRYPLTSNTIGDLCNKPELLENKKRFAPFVVSLSEADLFLVPPESSGLPSSRKLKSSIVCALLNLLLDSINQKPATNSVIFSQFGKILLLLEEPLKEAGFKILRIYGSVNAMRRATVIKAFRDSGPAGSTVLLVGHERAAKVDNQRDKNGEISMTEKSKYSYKEAEALIDEIDEHNESIHEVLRIKGVLLNHQEESETALFDSLRRLQLMNLSVVVLQATEIGNAVNALQKHWSKRITQLANILIKKGAFLNVSKGKLRSPPLLLDILLCGWDKVLEEWIDAAAAIKESAKNDAPAVFGEMGLPTPPMDEAAFLASQVPIELSELRFPFDGDGDFLYLHQLKFFDGIDEDGNVQSLHKDNMTQESKRSPQGKHQNATNVNVEHLKESKLLDDDVMQRKFETTKRKQGEDYQAADNARRKQAKLMDLHDLPKGGSGPSHRKPKQKNQKPERAHV
ncbi:DNA/RNA helicase protein [Quillaja saponaria]|uniref:DNA/RNA helicase protein n=1 Tax=Quillaja saponaria TaxID=32244 RepID=A0AAD7PZR6_QUISA|nr:DNA/RNA helicase protein [Quillaja saponaria]